MDHITLDLTKAQIVYLLDALDVAGHYLRDKKERDAMMALLTDMAIDAWGDDW